MMFNPYALVNALDSSPLLKNRIIAYDKNIKIY